MIEKYANIRTGSHSDCITVPDYLSLLTSPHMEQKRWLSYSCNIVRYNLGSTGLKTTIWRLDAQNVGLINKKKANPWLYRVFVTRRRGQERFHMLVFAILECFGTVMMFPH